MNRTSFLKTSALGLGALFQIPFTSERIPASELKHAFSDEADPSKLYHTLIVGGSFAGLSAAMGLGRCRRNVLVIDEGLPRNRTSPQANNLLSRDGQNPAEILSESRIQLLQYREYLTHLNGVITDTQKTDDGFIVSLEDGRTFKGQTLVFAGGVTDNLLEIDGLAELWGNGVYHCPYCHGWENRDKKTVVIGTGTSALGLASTVSNWTNDITYYSQNVEVDIPQSSLELVRSFGITIHEEKVTRISRAGSGVSIQLEGKSEPLFFETCYAPGRITANSRPAQTLGCEMRPNGSLVVNERYETDIEHTYAIGDICSRSNGQVVHAAYSGTVVAAAINNMFLTRRFS